MDLLSELFLIFILILIIFYCYRNEKKIEENKQRIQKNKDYIRGEIESIRSGEY